MAASGLAAYMMMKEMHKVQSSCKFFFCALQTSRVLVTVTVPLFSSSADYHFLSPRSKMARDIVAE